MIRCSAQKCFMMELRVFMLHGLGWEIYFLKRIDNLSSKSRYQQRRDITYASGFTPVKTRQLITQENEWMFRLFKFDYFARTSIKRYINDDSAKQGTVDEYFNCPIPYTSSSLTRPEKLCIGWICYLISWPCYWQFFSLQLYQLENKFLLITLHEPNGLLAFPSNLLRKRRLIWWKGNMYTIMRKKVWLKS